MTKLKDRIHFSKKKYVNLPLDIEGLHYDYILAKKDIEESSEKRVKRMEHNEPFIVRMLSISKVEHLITIKGVNEELAKFFMESQPYTTYQEILEQDNGFDDDHLHNAQNKIEESVLASYDEYQRIVGKLREA